MAEEYNAQGVSDMRLLDKEVQLWLLNVLASMKRLVGRSLDGC